MCCNDRKIPRRLSRRPLSSQGGETPRLRFRHSITAMSCHRAIELQAILRSSPGWEPALRSSATGTFYKGLNQLNALQNNRLARIMRCIILFISTMRGYPSEGSPAIDAPFSLTQLALQLIRATPFDRVKITLQKLGGATQMIQLGSAGIA